MINRNYLLLFILLISISCKTKKETVVSDPIREPATKTTQTEENKKNKMLIKEFQPEENAKISDEDLQVLNHFAHEKAEYNCKKQNFGKLLDAGEKIDQSELKLLDSLIIALDFKIMKFSKEPSYQSYFNEEYNSLIKNCGK